MYRLNPSYWQGYARNFVNRYVNRYLGRYTRRVRWLQRPGAVMGVGCALVAALACATLACLALAGAVLLRGL